MVRIAVVAEQVEALVAANDVDALRARMDKRIHFGTSGALLVSVEACVRACGGMRWR